MAALEDGEVPLILIFYVPYLKCELNLLAVWYCTKKQVGRKRDHVELRANAVRSGCILKFTVAMRGISG